MYQRLLVPMLALALAADLPAVQPAATQPATTAPIALDPPEAIYAHVVDLVGSASHVVLLRDANEALAKLNDAGKPIALLSRKDVPVPAGADFAPVAITWASASGRDSGGDLLVLAEGGSSIHRFDGDLQPKGRLLHDPTMRGAALCVGPNGDIFVADRARPGIRVFDPQGKPLAAHGKKGTFDAHAQIDAEAADKFSEPAGICLDREGRLLVSDRANMTYVIYAYDAAAHMLGYKGHGQWMARPNRIMLNRVSQIVLTGALDYYGDHGFIRVLQVNGRPVNGMAGYDVGMMSPRCTLTMGPRANMYVADPDRGRILIVPFLFYEQPPTLAWGGPITVQMEANRIDRTGTVLTTVNCIPVPTSQPAWVTVAQQRALLDAWPPLKPAEMRPYVVPLVPSAGRNYAIDMPVVIAVFTQARMEGKETVTMEKEQLGDRQQREFARVRDFYFRNSQGLLNLQFEYMVLDDVTAEVKGGWIPPEQGRRRVNDARRKANLPLLIDSDSLVTLFPRAGWDGRAMDDPGVVGGPGLTVFGYSSFGLVNRGIAWLLCHEWNHQLDGYFDRSGMPEFWLNHPDGTVHLGRFGQHWDCNAFVMRRMNRMQWLQLKYGVLRLVKDSDADGLADDDASLALDENRFGSDPLKRDTDGDGVDDLGEATASSFFAGDPRKTDTDADGLPDKTDPYPTLPVKFSITTHKVALDGKIDANEYSPLGSLHADWVRARVSAARGQDRIYVAFEFDQPLDTLHADVDLDNNGWFAGFDNIPAAVTLDWTKPDAPTAKKATACKAVLGVKDKHYTLEMEIPFEGYTSQSPPYRGDLGLMIHALMGEHHEAFLIDPWALLRCEWR